MKNLNYLFLFIFITSCGIYSFNGASITKNTETISINYFINSAKTKQPILSQVLTEKLKDYFTQQTNLAISQDDGDLNFKGEIIKYEIKPTAIKSNETAGQNRLTISINVEFKNILDDKNDFKHTFTRYRDYESSENLTDIESVLINEISNELVEDIFNKSVVNW